jgi:arylsulfatase A-like enzyme
MMLLTVCKFLVLSLVLLFCSSCSAPDPVAPQPIQRLIDLSTTPIAWKWENDSGEDSVAASEQNKMVYQVILEDTCRKAVVIGKDDVYTHVLDNPGSGKLEFWAAGIDKNVSGTPQSVQVKISLTSQKTTLSEIVTLKCIDNPNNPWKRFEMPLTDLYGPVECSMELVATGDQPLRPERYAVIGSPVFVPDAVQTPPNVVIICIDSLRDDELGAYGSPFANTATMDLLSKQGVLFSQAVSTTSWTVPAVKSLLAGYQTMQEIPEGVKLTPEAGFTGKMLQELYAEAGYFTVAVIANPLITPQIGFEKGFDIFDMYAVRTWYEGSAPDIYRRIDSILKHHGNRPLFMYIHFMDPHDPHTPNDLFNKMNDAPPDDAVRDALHPKVTGFLNLEPQKTELLPLTDTELQYLRAYYRNELRETDTYIYCTLRSLNQYSSYPENTLLIVTGDHGEEFGEHGFYQHGMSLYETTVRVPWIMTFPSTIPTNHIESGWVSLIDIAPTVSALTLNTHLPSWKGCRVFPKQPDYPANRQIYTVMRTRDDDSIPRERWRGVYRNEKKLIWLPSVVMGFDLDRHPEERELFRFPSLEVMAAGDCDSEWKALGEDLQLFVDSIVHEPEPRMPQTLMMQLKELGYVH